MSNIPQLPVVSHNASPAEIKAAFEKLRVYFAYVQKTGGFTAGTTTTIIQESTGGGTEPVYDIPTPPTNLAVSGAFNTIILQWDHPVYNGHAYTEVWRYDSDDLGNADYIGATEASMYSDTPPDSSLTTTYYYWVRHVNRNMVNGTFNATPGTPGATADDPEYVLELLLDSKWKATTAMALNFIGYPTTPNGFAYKSTTAGTSGATEPAWPLTVGLTVADGTITWTCLAVLPMTLPFEIGLIGGVPTPVLKSLLIGDATITSAKIQSLAADKITTGKLVAGITMTESLSALNADIGVVTSGMVRSPNSMRYMDLNASGAQRFLSLKDDSGTDQFWVAANGMGFINQGWLSQKTALTFDASGTWTVPAWCSQVVIDMCGGGGGGRRGDDYGGYGHGAGGNGGVNVTGQVINVTPNSTIQVYVGAGGGSGASGGSSSFLSVVAAGGNASINGTAPVAQPNAASGGGFYTAGGSTSYYTGGTSGTYYGGGGGASNYGNGGAGGKLAPGNSGGIGGGGGGGGTYGYAGGSGGHGRVVIHF